MSIEKITKAPTNIEVVQKINELIDGSDIDGFGGYWEAGEQVDVGDMRYIEGRDNVGYILECVQAGTTGGIQPSFSVNDVEPSGGASIMQGATATENGKEGLVPAPSVGDENKFLSGDGTFKEIEVPEVSLSSMGVTATAEELNYVNGVTSNVQTQLNSKAPAYQYSTIDLTAGTSALTTGQLYLVYE